MQLRVDRIESDEESTLGRLYIDGQFECWTLEDQYRQGPKVKGKTRIPAGRYNVQLRREGGFHSEYLARYKEPWHQGMLHVRDVPGFEYILIHVGNSHDDTEGCLLIGKGKAIVERHHYITESRGAYTAFYPKVRDELMAGRLVEIEYRDMDPASMPQGPMEPLVASAPGEGGPVAPPVEGEHRGGAAAGAIAVAGGAVAAVGGVLVGDNETTDTATTGAGSTGGAPVGAGTPATPGSTGGDTQTGGGDVFGDLIARAMDPANRLEVILIGLGVLIVLFAIYLLVRRWNEWRSR